MSSSSNIALFSNDPLITSSSSIFNSDHLLHLSPSPLFKWCLHNPESKEKEVQEKNHYHHSIGDHHMLLLPMHPNAHMVQPVYIWLSYKKHREVYRPREIRLIACSSEDREDDHHHHHTKVCKTRQTRQTTKGQKSLAKRRRRRRGRIHNCAAAHSAKEKDSS